MVALAFNDVYPMDCLEGLAAIAPGTIDLAFADPPFNIGYEYDVYHDQRPAEEYLAWSRQWMAAVVRALKPSGSFWLAIGDEFAAELKVIAQRELGLCCRSWVIWYYTFGVNCVRAFSRSHTHLLYFVKDPAHFTFNAQNPAVRVPSARQLVYADGRANPRGRLPDNTWILRPQDVPGGFAPHHDVWYFSRVAGTFKEREGFHGCQMPEQLLGRILRCSSNPMEVVLDPFAGSGTTLVVAKKLGRQWIGFELSKDYVARIRRRLDAAAVGDPLDGPEDPLVSAPPTAKGRRRLSPRKAASRGQRPPSLPDLDAAVLAGYRSACASVPVDQVLADPERNASFVEACRRHAPYGDAALWNRTLLKLRKDGKLAGPRKHLSGAQPRQTDAYLFGSEVAMHQLSVECGLSLDEILCDPRLAAGFDEMAAAFAPGFAPRQYRWAALSLRKRAHDAKKAARQLLLAQPRWRLPRPKPFAPTSWQHCAGPGVYVLEGPGGQTMYVGETLDLKARLDATFRIPAWTRLGIESIRILADPPKRHGLQSLLIGRLRPLLNSRLLALEAEAIRR